MTPRRAGMGLSRAFLAALVGAYLLTGCATSQPLVRTVVLAPPDALTTPCEKPQERAHTNEELASYTVALKGALTACSDALAGVRQWVRDAQAASQK